MSNAVTPESYSDYLDWKGWDKNSNFGTIDQPDFVHFTKELKAVAGDGGRTLNVLEIGFGEGHFLGYARKRGWHVTGVEINVELVEVAKAAGFVAITSDEMGTLPDASFDLIAAFDVLEHIPQTDTVAVLATLRSKLKPDGAVFLRFPNADHWIGAHNQNGDPTHVTAVGYSKLCYFAAMSGLSIASFRGARRRGFESGVAHGIYKLLTEPLKRFKAEVERLFYVPGLPIVLYNSDCIAVLRKADKPAPKG